MGKKPSGGGGGWLATVRMVFKSSKNERHGKKRGGEAEGAAVGSGEAADIVSVDHFPTAETSPEVTNEGSSGAVVWREKGEHEVAGAARRDRQGIAAAMTAASRVARSGAARGNAGSREERAAVRIQAFYRGYLARRARRALRGLVLLQALVRGHQVRRQVHLTMRCMQALIRAQTRVRARRLTSHLPRRATQLDAQYRRPGLVDLVPSRAQGARLSFGHSIASHSLPGTWDAEPADGMPRRRDALAASWGDSAPTYACGLQHQRQLNELQLDDNDESSGGWRWLEHCHTGGQPKQQASQHGPTETSYVTAAATDGVSENTVEMEEAASRKSPTRDLYPVRPPAIPGYMAATQSALAKTRMAPPPAPRAGTRTRSGSVAHSGGLTSSIANLGWSMSHGAASTHAPQHRAGHSPESSCSGDRTPPVFGDRRKLAFG